MGRLKVNRYFIKNSSSQIERIKEALELLELSGMGASFEKLADKFLKTAMTPYDFLEALLEKEVGLKEQNRFDRWLDQACFPWVGTVVGFDFSFNKTVNERQIKELASCRFIENKENIILIGPSGVGKTHIAIGLGVEAIGKGKQTKFTTLEKLDEKIEKINGDATKEKWFLDSLLRQDLLIIDQMNLHEVSVATKKFLYKLLMRRYETGSVIFTSNDDVEKWSSLFENQTQAMVILDRILHHCHVVNISGKSYRVQGEKDKKRTNGHITSQQTLNIAS